MRTIEITITREEAEDALANMPGASWRFTEHCVVAKALQKALGNEHIGCDYHDYYLNDGSTYRIFRHGADRLIKAFDSARHGNKYDLDNLEFPYTFEAQHYKEEEE